MTTKVVVMLQDPGPLAGVRGIEFLLDGNSKGLLQFGDAREFEILAGEHTAKVILQGVVKRQSKDLKFTVTEGQNVYIEGTYSRTWGSMTVGLVRELPPGTKVIALQETANEKIELLPKQEDSVQDTTVAKTRSARIRSNLIAIEAIEFGILNLLFGFCFGIFMLPSMFMPSTRGDVASTLAMIPVMLFSSIFAVYFLWGVYLLYIILARAGGPIIDIGLWIVMAIITGSFTFWCWSILDINRLIVSKLFYRGEAPVEYAWSQASKRRYKEWKQHST